MPLNLYTKIRNQTKRQALDRLTYGQGSVTPDHLAPYRRADGFPVQNGQRLVTSDGAMKKRIG